MSFPLARALLGRRRTRLSVASLGAAASAAYIIGPLLVTSASLGATEALSRLMSTVSVLGPVAAGAGSFASIRPAISGYHHLLDGAARPRSQVIASQLRPIAAFAAVCYVSAAGAAMAAYGLAGARGRFEWVAAFEPLVVICAMGVAGFAIGIAAKAVAAPWLLTIMPFVVTTLAFVTMAALADQGTDRRYLFSGFDAVSMEFWQDISLRFLAIQAALFGAAAALLICILSLEASARRSLPSAAVAVGAAVGLFAAVSAADSTGPMLRPASAVSMSCAGRPVAVCAWTEDAPTLDEFAARANRIYAAAPADLRPTMVLQWGLPAATDAAKTGRFRSVPEDPIIAGAVATDQMFLIHGCSEAPMISASDPLRPILVALRAVGAQSPDRSSAPTSAGALTPVQSQMLRAQVDRLCKPSS